MMRRALIIASIATMATAYAQERTPVPAQIIALAEEFEGESSTSEGPAAYTTQLRAAFAKTPEGWRIVCRLTGMEGDRRECTPANLDETRDWSISTAGKRTRIATRGWYQPERTTMLGMLTIVEGTIPRSGTRSGEFAGWMGGEFARPVVALANGAAMKPTDWKPAPLRRSDLEAAIKTLAESIGEVPGCSPDKPGPKIGAQHLVTGASLASNRGERVFSVALDRKLLGDCDGPPSIEWSDFWFVAPARGQPSMVNVGYSRPHAVRLRLVAIGDFDGDGKAELVLWQSTINEDGYILLFDGFAKGIKGAWTYH